MINLILLGIILLFVLTGFVVGLVRGLKKSAFRTAWIIVGVFLALFVAKPVTQLILNINISGLNIVVDDIHFNSVQQGLTALIQNMIGADTINSIPSLNKLLEVLPVMIVSPFAFTLVFWSFKILLLPFWQICAHLLFKKQENSIVRKHSLLGGVCGIFIGLIVCGATLVPAFGVLNILSQMDEIKLENQTNITALQNEESQNNSQSLLDQFFGEGAEYVRQINSSPVQMVYTLTAIKPIAEAEVAFLTSAKINNTNISLSEEIYSTASIAKSLIEVKDINLNNLTQQDLQTLINASNNVVDILSDMNLVKAVGSDFISYIANQMLNNKDFILTPPSFNDEKLDGIVNNGLIILTNATANSLLDDVKTLIESASLLNSKNMILPVINNQLSLQQVKNVYLSQNESFYNQIIDNICNISLVKKLSPLLIDATLDKTLNQFDINYSNTISKDNYNLYNNQLNKILKDVVSIAKTINFDTDYYINSNTIALTGELLSDLTNNIDTNSQQQLYIINPETLSNIKAKTQEFLNNQIAKIGEIESEDILTEIVNNISSVSNFKEEFDKLSDAFENLEHIYPIIKQYIQSDYANALNLKSINLENIGKAFNKLNSTTLINNNFYKIYNYGINSFSRIAEKSDVLFKNVANALVIENNSPINFAKQLSVVQDFYNQIIDFIDTESLNDAINSNEIKKLGNNLQNIKTFNKSLNEPALINVDNIIVELLKVVIDNTTNQTLKDLSLNIASEIENSTNKNNINYSVEFAHIANSYELMVDGLDLDNLTTPILNIVNGTDNLPASTILVKPIYLLIKDNLPSGEDYSQQVVKNILNNAKNNMETTINVNYVNEINYFIRLYNSLNTLNNLDINDDNFEQTLTALSQTIEEIANSMILTNVKTECINYFIEQVINNLNEDDNDLINVINQAKLDAINANSSLIELYNDINSMKETINSLNLNNVDINLQENIALINSSLINIANLFSFNTGTTNEIYKIILNKANTSVQEIDTSELPEPKKTEMDDYKLSFNEFINKEITDLQQINMQDVNENYYQNSLLLVKEKLNNNPLI